MGGRGIASYLLLPLLISGLLTSSFTHETASQSPTRIFVDPQNLIDLSKTADSVFTIRINISDVIGLSYWGLYLRYNTALLYTNPNMINEGPFLRQGGPTFFNAKIVEDYIALGATLLGPSQVEGSGILATITFKVKTLGESILQLFKTELIDVSFSAIPHEADNGYFRNVTSTGLPVAKFVHVANGYNVTFNASNSLDPDGAITSYVWFWGGKSLDSVRNSTTTEPVISHQYPGIDPPVRESALVRLIVVSDDGVASNIFAVLIAFGTPVHDVAIIDLYLLPSDVGIGQKVSVNITARNEGNQAETLGITISQNITETDYGNITNTQWKTIQTKTVQSGAGREETKLAFVVDTVGLSLGTYVIKAEAKLVPNEMDTSDNFLLEYFVATRFLDWPVAKFSYSPTNPKVGDTLILNATESLDPDGNIVSYLWDFGDGNSTTVSAPIITHAFRASGDYVVRLNVTDNDGLIDTEMTTISVAESRSDFSLYLAVALVIVFAGAILIAYWRRRKRL